MKILVTGAKGFVGKNLSAELMNIASGKRRKHPLEMPVELLRYDADDTEETLRAYCEEADIVVNLAGVNRPKDEREFMEGNAGFARELTGLLSKRKTPCPLILSSSIQAELDNPYGRSKLAAENAVMEYSEKTGAEVFIFRFPNLFGKWCRPNYNSVVATFCSNIANGLPIRVDDESKLLTLAYIDDVVEAIIECAAGQRQPGRQQLSTVYEVSLGRLARLISSFREDRAALRVPDVSDPFVKKLYSTYLSYVPAEEAAVEAVTRSDERGSFTELLKLPHDGQISVNVCRPGCTKGNHWHHTKTEKFIVVSGSGVIEERRIDSGKITRIEVGGKAVCAVDMLPGFTHSITNTGEEDLVFIIWANELFDPDRPDTFFETV
ncbi:MAG: NAD-dependent epimerase/dehydratase family protein [Clostridia bacterium]|nr:NAD-dependent epimerase/dehydratase family protein [Clostridia bacterium]